MPAADAEPFTYAVHLWNVGTFLLWSHVWMGAGINIEGNLYLQYFTSRPTNIWRNMAVLRMDKKKSSSPAMFLKITSVVFRCVHWLLFRGCVTEAGCWKSNQDPWSMLALPLALPALARLSSTMTASAAPVKPPACSTDPGLTLRCLALSP